MSEALEFQFPPNPGHGDVVLSPNGSSWRWDDVNNRWHPDTWTQPGEAPLDGKDYVRNTAQWKELGAGGGLDEAAADELYVRRDGGTSMEAPLRIEHVDTSIVWLSQLTVGPATNCQWALGADYLGQYTGGVGSGFAIARLDPMGQLLDCPIAISDGDGTINVLSPGIHMNGNMLVGLPSPSSLPPAVQSSAAVTKGYVDGLVERIRVLEERLAKLEMRRRR